MSSLFPRLCLYLLIAILYLSASPVDGINVKKNHRLRRQLIGGNRGILGSGSGSPNRESTTEPHSVNCEALSPEEREQTPSCRSESGRGVSGVLPGSGSVVPQGNGSNTLTGITSGLTGVVTDILPLSDLESAQKFGIAQNELADPETISLTYPPEVTERMLTQVYNELSEAGPVLPVPVTRQAIFVSNAPFQRYQTCNSDYFGTGHCRYIHHCLLPDLIFNVGRLIKHVCLINGIFIGLCCPDTSYIPKPVAPTQSPRPPPSPTSAPQPPAQPEPTAPSVGSDNVRASCGLNFETRIVGGSEADPQDWLWIAALLRNNGQDQFCGGSLVTEKHVLTAAHCTIKYTASQLTVGLGIYDLSDQGTARSQIRNVVEIRNHPEYDRRSQVHDISILLLDQPATFTTYVRPVCMPIPRNTYFGEEGTVVGWGTLDYGGPSTKKLHEIQIPVWNNTDCQRAFGLPIIDEFLCAGVRDGTRDSCQGDSGGPLMLPGPRRRWMQIGIVSWGIRCGEPGYPGVYTRVTEYLQWIYEKTSD